MPRTPWAHARQLQLVLPVSLTASRTPTETALAAVIVGVVVTRSCVARAAISGVSCLMRRDAFNTKGPRQIHWSEVSRSVRAANVAELIRPTPLFSWPRYTLHCYVHLCWAALSCTAPSRVGPTLTCSHLSYIRSIALWLHGRCRQHQEAADFLHNTRTTNVRV